MSNTEKFVTASVLDRFLAYAEDAANWSGCPLAGGNVGGDAADKGYLVNMKKAGLITTTEEREGREISTWIEFTDKGVELAAAHGFSVYE